ncbi:hypothetical protein [Clostridium lundense]|uniref:hypothetical protein n=1 Tax=Clostridium lundense TaxID=319475 RepID=UPI0004823E92|nr:hypothetical protein [Clostridium lundense]
METINCTFKVENNIKYILSKIDKDINTELLFDLLIILMKEYNLNIEVIIKIASNMENDTDKLLNKLSNLFYSIGFYDEVILLLFKSYNINSYNIDTVFSLGYILNLVGEKELAIKYLKEIEEKDEEARRLLEKL